MTWGGTFGPYAAGGVFRSANERTRRLAGGGGGIRTHERRKPLPVFKTGAFNRSATHPSPEIGYLVTRHTARKGGLAPQNSRSGCCRTRRPDLLIKDE